MKDWFSHIDEVKKTATKEQLANKVWRLQNLYAIQNKEGMLIPMKLNPHQTRLLSMIKESPTKPLSLLKSRQIGGTTFCCIFFLDEACWNGGVSAVIVAHLEKSIKDIFRIVTLAYDKLPDKYKDSAGIKSDKATDTEISMPRNNSRIEVQLEVRSKAVTHILYSEYAFMKQDRIIASMGALTPKSLKIYESTPHGLNHFYNLYKDLKDQKRSMFVPWFAQAEYKIEGDKIEDLTGEEAKLIRKHGLTHDQIRFRRDKIMVMGDLKFRQEYPEDDVQCFLLSGDSVINRYLIMEQIEWAKKNPPIDEIRQSALLIKVFRKFTDEELDKLKPAFFVGVDPAEGVGRDYSACVVIANYLDHSSEVVMTMRGFEEPVNFARIIHRYIKSHWTFKDTDGEEEVVPLMIVERNNHGHVVLSQFKGKELYYPRLFCEEKDARAGFLTTHNTKKFIQNDLFAAIQERMIRLRDQNICDEILTLSIQDNGSIKAEEGCHDDMFMATCLAYHGVFKFQGGIDHSYMIEVLDDPYKEEEEEEE